MVKTPVLLPRQQNSKTATLTLVGHHIPHVTNKNDKLQYHTRSSKTSTPNQYILATMSFQRDPSVDHVSHHDSCAPPALLHNTTHDTPVHTRTHSYTINEDLLATMCEQRPTNN